MAAVLGNLEIGIKKTGNAVRVPADHRARLMFYLDCICNVLNLQNDTEDIARMRNYHNYASLSDDELDQLLVLCLLVSPDELLDKVIFANDQMCGDFQNEFYELSAVQNRLLVTNSILIGGTQRKVQNIMTFKMSFLEQNYIQPMRYYQTRLERIVNNLHVGSQPQHQQPAIIFIDTRDNDDSECCCTIL